MNTPEPDHGRYTSAETADRAARSRRLSTQAANAARQRLVEAHRGEYDRLYREEALMRGLRARAGALPNGHTEWVPAPDCTVVHEYGEEGWRPGMNGEHEHLNVHLNTETEQA